MSLLLEYFLLMFFFRGGYAFIFSLFFVAQLLTLPDCVTGFYFWLLFLKNERENDRSKCNSLPGNGNMPINVENRQIYFKNGGKGNSFLFFIVCFVFSFLSTSGTNSSQNFVASRSTRGRDKCVVKNRKPFYRMLIFKAG